ncbi:hypothetical protein [Caballeronia sp. AZ10_KS36]|uniref:hypothetical protein n=1 Tax=Caballeronia sp. AZ10_KS36 TaxID=2921757 RepID=UPI0020286402|nr:hypothetical protein [Caballeronia sp. AZ10_KS36]
MSGDRIVEQSEGGCTTPWKTYYELFDDEVLNVEIQGVDFEVLVVRQKASILLRLPRELARQLGFRVGERFWKEDPDGIADSA